ncbi:RNA-guided endonuclease TnpB family protein [Moorena sp. SIO3A2]|uniref:RNA-guided endonuclease InsQ/TnpB family protein n=1 Tax=Moorena sp. SIO3A2 TaxID=2607841 RepID=UPI0013BB6547|nr:RNA-guided endonuclease TnpB family protein [Moorena sp. SIO3A2]NER87514.1 IS200/IS605 family element transposase accessory protein TnpB [Moorena sp. SIO3A2]
MKVLEFKAKGNKTQYAAIDEAIRTGQFVRNKCLRYWMDNKGVGQKELYRHNTWLRAEYPFVKDLNSHACQASVERAYSSIARFYDKCKKKAPGKKGYPKFKKFSRFGVADAARTVEYKTSGWKLSGDAKSINFLDKKGIGKLKLKGTWELWRYEQKLIKRVRLVRRADGYYVQFCIKVDEKESLEPTHTNIGLDVGLKEFYTDSKGGVEPNPRFYRKSEKRLKFHQRRVSRKKKGSANRKKAINRLGRTHLKINRRREEHAKRLARCVIHSNDVVAYEDLRVKNLIKNHCLAKSINDAGWYQFRKWLEYFGQKFGRQTIAVNPAYTSQNCSSCGAVVKKTLSTRTHTCKCGCQLDRDHNAAINILKRALGTVGHTGTWILDPNALGEDASTLSDSGLKEQATSLIKESPFL